MPSLAVPLRWLALLLVLLLLAACSRVELLYRNLDWLIPWKLGDYLSLDAEQDDWLDARLDAHLRWHCSSELPRYVDWLDRQRPLLAASPAPAEIVGPLTEAYGLLQPTFARAAEDGAQLLAGLSPTQVDELEQRLAEEQAELREEHLEGPLVERLERRTKRMEKRLTDWLGPLHAQQRAYLRLWAARQEANVRPWLDNRERWQAQLLEYLRLPQRNDLATRLQPLLASPARYWGADYRRATSRARQALAELLSELWASATPVQRVHLQHRLERLRDDLEGLVCRA